MDVSVELQYLFYPLHQMHNLWSFVPPPPSPFIYLLHDNICISLKAKCCRIYITYQPRCVSFLQSHFDGQTSNKKKRHTLIKQNFAMTACKSLVQPVNRQKQYANNCQLNLEIRGANFKRSW